MKKILIGIIIALAAVLFFKTCSDNKKEESILQESSMLIEQQINNVSKLVVTEGHFSEVYNYKDSQLIFGSLMTASKKALVVVNADVDVAYDLSEIDFKIDKENKILHILSVPEPEIKVRPEFEYYDVTADFFNAFDAKDYNKIKVNATASIEKKIEASDIKINAKNRLISELSKFYILTNSLGWTLQYNDEQIKDVSQFETLNF